MQLTNLKTMLSYCLTGMTLTISFAEAAIGQEKPSATPRVMMAVRIQSSPKIDGKLDDLCWRLAYPTTGFIQMDPDEGKLATEQTVVRVLYDDETLCFGIECLDSQPQKIISRLVPRESNFWPGDVISIVLDTFHDHQNCYVFQVNPRGVQRDARSDSDGRKGWGGIDIAWDGLWWSEARVTDRGWTAEIAIPFKTLRFSRDQKQIWGINIQRYQGSKREDSNWSFISRDDGQTIKVSKAGHLVELEDIKPGLDIKFLPYGTTRYERKAGKWRGDKGLSLKYGITSDFTLDATLNPDFCHIEADEERINLTRFELFYTEKRPFFIERSELFTPMNLFYSRRIADPRFGLKFTGKLRGWSLGLLTAVDKEKGTDPTYGVLRLQKDIFRNSSVGILGVGKQKTGDPWGRALGLDLGLRPGNNILNLNLAKSFNRGIKKDDWKVSLWLGHFSDKLSIDVRFSDIQPEFNVDQTGYVPHDLHVGEKEIRGEVSYRPRIGKFGIKQIGLGQWISVTKRTDDDKRGWHWKNANIYIELDNLDTISFGHDDWYLRYQQKGYKGKTLGLGYWIPSKGFINKSYIGVRTGDQYDWEDGYFGYIRALSISMEEIKVLDNLTLDFNGNVVWEYFSSGKLDEIKKAGNFRVTYLPKRNIFLRIFVPINPAARQYAINALISYAYRPMSRFCLAYNEQRGEHMKLTDRIIMAKISYLWNL